MRSFSSLKAPLYSILAVYMPLSFLVSFAAVCAAMLAALGVGVSIPFGSLWIPAFLSALAASFYHYFMGQVKSGRLGADIRGGILVLAIAYTVVSLFRFGIPLGSRFLPGLSNCLAVLFSLYMWISVISLKRIFKMREIFESYTEKYGGEKLREAMLEDAVELQEGDGAMGKMKVAYTIQLSILIILAAVCGAVKIRLPLPLYGLLILLVVNVVFIYTWVNLLRDERYYAGEGLPLSEGDRLGRVPGMFFFTAACAGAAVLLASDRSVLSFSLITGFFSWLISLFPRSTPQAQSEPLIPDMPAPMPLPGVPAFMEQEAENAAPWPIWDWLQYAGIGLLLLGFIWFMIKPLLSKGRFSGEGLSFAERLKRMVILWLKSLRALLANGIAIFKKRDSSVKLSDIDEARVRRLSSDLLKDYAPAKRREMRQSVTLFARLIIWGTEHRHVSWRPSYAPGEYCAYLAAAGDSLAASIVKCGEIFEQALYSSEVLPGERQKEFRDLVKEITGSSE
jgi:hypothetical protein